MNKRFFDYKILMFFLVGLMPHFICTSEAALQTEQDNSQVTQQKKVDALGDDKKTTETQTDQVPNNSPQHYASLVPQKNKTEKEESEASYLAVLTDGVNALANVGKNAVQPLKKIPEKVKKALGKDQPVQSTNAKNANVSGMGTGTMMLLGVGIVGAVVFMYQKYQDWLEERLVKAERLVELMVSNATEQERQMAIKQIAEITNVSYNQDQVTSLSDMQVSMLLKKLSTISSKQQKKLVLAVALSLYSISEQNTLRLIDKLLSLN